MASVGISFDRVAQARQHLEACGLCEHRCAVDRLAGERGPCHAGAEARVFRHRVECGEELELIPSHLFYLSGCDLRCAFCIAEANAFDPRRGEQLTAEYFREALVWGRQQGARNVQWVGGEPTIHLPAILDVLQSCDDLPPIVWKSDFHGTPEAFELLSGIVDVYVADFKFGNDQCARRIASVDNYVSILLRNLELAAAQADLIVRHLVLPGHFECCFVPLVQALKHHLPDVKFSLRSGYLPRWLASRHPELVDPLSTVESTRALAYAERSRLRLIV
jgi:putative pyruvate formate lyase activating enzyme